MNYLSGLKEIPGIQGVGLAAVYPRNLMIIALRPTWGDEGVNGQKSPLAAVVAISHDLIREVNTVDQKMRIRHWAQATSDSPFDETVESLKREWQDKASLVGFVGIGYKDDSSQHASS